MPFLKTLVCEPGITAHGLNPSIQETEMGESRIQGHPQLPSEFQASWCYIKHHLTKLNRNSNPTKQKCQNSYLVENKLKLLILFSYYLNVLFIIVIEYGFSYCSPVCSFLIAQKNSNTHLNLPRTPKNLQWLESQKEALPNHTFSEDQVAVRRK